MLVHGLQYGKAGSSVGVIRSTLPPCRRHEFPPASRTGSTLFPFVWKRHGKRHDELSHTMLDFYQGMTLHRTNRGEIEDLPLAPPC